MRTKAQIEETRPSEDSRDDVGRWVESAAPVSAESAARNDMRAVAEKYTERLGEAFSRLAHSA